MRHNERKQNGHHLIAQLIELDASQIRMISLALLFHHHHQFMLVMDMNGKSNKKVGVQ